jgi:branched-chain amino acid transport system permease protein
MRLAQGVGLALVVAVAVAFPHLGASPLVMTIAVFTLVYAVMASAWNILGGFTGYISLGHASFFGIGAYAMALVCQHLTVTSGYEPFFLLPVVGLVAAVCAVPLGIITLRVRRHVFVVLTIAMLFIGQLMATNLHDLTGGSSGLSFPTPPWMGADFNPPFYYAGLIVLACSVAVSWWISRSKFGLGLRAIRDDEDRALGLGINTGAYKLACFVLAAFFIGMAGALWGYFQSYIYPQTVFDPLFDIAMVLMTFTGGLGTLAGPVLGALLIEPAHEYFTIQYGASGLYLILYGGLFLVVILLLPQGIIPSLRLLLYRQQTRRSRAAAKLEAGRGADSVAPGTGRAVKP